MIKGFWGPGLHGGALLRGGLWGRVSTHCNSMGLAGHRALYGPHVWPETESPTRKSQVPGRVHVLGIPLRGSIERDFQALLATFRWFQGLSALVRPIGTNPGHHGISTTLPRCAQPKLAPRQPLCSAVLRVK